MCPRCACAHHTGDSAAAALVRVPGQYSNCNKGAHEAEVEDDGQERKECDAAEEACQDNSERSVDDCRSCDTRNSFCIYRNV